MGGPLKQLVALAVEGTVRADRSEHGGFRNWEVEACIDVDGARVYVKADHPLLANAVEEALQQIAEAKGIETNELPQPYAATT